MGYSIGDSIALDVHAHPAKYRIAGIVMSEGIYADEAHVATAVMNRAHLDDIFEMGGDSNAIYIKLQPGVNKQERIAEWRALYGSALITDSVERAEESRNGNNASVTFLIVSCFAILVSAFIIYTSYSVIMSQSLREIGTFRSVGATRSKMIIVFLLESGLIGLVGGAAGVFTGILASKRILEVNTTQSIRDAATRMTIRPETTFAVLVFALILSLLGSIIPIIRSSTRPLKEILLDTSKAPRNNRIIPAIAGCVLVAISIVALPLIPKNMISAIVGIRASQTTRF